MKEDEEKRASQAKSDIPVVIDNINDKKDSGAFIIAPGQHGKRTQIIEISTENNQNLSKNVQINSKLT